MGRGGDGAVRQTVYFTVTVRSEEREGHWLATGLQTGIIAAGGTREEAETRNGKAHVMLVEKYKESGLDRLAEFMETRSIEYRIGDGLDEAAAPPERREDGDRDIACAA